MDQSDIDNMNYALLAGEISHEALKINERGYSTIHRIVMNHSCGERSEVIKRIFKDLRNKAEKIIQPPSTRGRG